MIHLKRASVYLFCFILLFIALPYQTALGLIGEGVEAYPPTIGKPAKYRIRFEIAKTIKVHDWIAFLFSPGFDYKEPKEEPPGDEIIPPPWPPWRSPCESCQGLPIIEKWEDGSIFLKFNSHIELDPSKEGYKNITVTIPKEAGFINPENPGLYSIKVKTQKEPEWVIAGEVEIVKPNPPGVYITEIGKKGQADWYISKPDVYMECLDYGTDICYSINFKNYKPVTGKSHQIQFENGQYIRDIYFYISKDNEKQTDWGIVTVFVDTISPAFTIQIPDSGFVTSEEVFLLKGQIDRQVFEDRGYDRLCLSAISFHVDNIPIAINSVTGDFETFLKLQPGDNYFQLEAVDQASNITSKQLVFRREP